MDYSVLIPVLIAFALSVAMGPLIIPVLRKLKMGQTEREEGVKSHLKKAIRVLARRPWEALLFF